MMSEKTPLQNFTQGLNNGDTTPIGTPTQIPMPTAGPKPAPEPAPEPEPAEPEATPEPEPSPEPEPEPEPEETPPEEPQPNDDSTNPDIDNPSPPDGRSFLEYMLILGALVLVAGLLTAGYFLLRNMNRTTFSPTQNINVLPNNTASQPTVTGPNNTTTGTTGAVVQPTPNQQPTSNNTPVVPVAPPTDPCLDLQNRLDYLEMRADSLKNVNKGQLKDIYTLFDQIGERRLANDDSAYGDPMRTDIARYNELVRQYNISEKSWNTLRLQMDTLSKRIKQGNC